MVEHTDSSIPLLSNENSPLGQHQRTAPAFPILDSIPKTRRNSNSRIDASKESSLRNAGPTSLAPLRKHHPSNSLSSDALTQPKSAAHGTARQDIGRDWESWRLPQADKLDVDFKVPWQQASRPPRLARGHNEMQRNSDSPLGLSSVQPMLVYSPKRPFKKPNPISPITLGPQSAASSEEIRLPSRQPPSPDSDSDSIPKYMSAFEYAMRPFLGTHIDHERHLCLPSSMFQESASPSTSPLLPSLRDDEISYTGSEEEEAEKDTAEYGIPSHLKEKDAFRTRMRLIQLRTLLMRCTILQSSVREIERKPWAQDAMRPPHWYYSKMRYLAQTAQRLAEALDSQDLRARCEYWAGRGCGGARDYYAAAEHFALAIKLDVKNDAHPTKPERVRLRGLRPNEKADVHFLLQSVSDRYTKWEHKTAHARKVAEYESEWSRQPLNDCVDWKGMPSPLWLPDRDRVMQIARLELGIQKKLGKKSRFLEHMERARRGQDLEGKWQVQGVAEGADETTYNDETKMTRRVLDEKEWRYIWHGDEIVAEQRARQESAAKAANPHPTLGKPSSCSATGTSFLSDSSQSPRHTSKKAPPSSHPTLEDELGQVDWPTSLPRTPSSTEGLRQRRNVSLNLISTENTQKCSSLGNSMQATPVASDIP